MAEAMTSDDYTGHLIVYDLDENVTKEVLYEEFRRIGRVKDTHVTTNKTQQRMGFVNMFSIDEAAAAVANLHQRPPFRWTLRLNEPLEIRRHRAILRKKPDKAAAEMTSELSGRVEAFSNYENNFKRLVKEFASKLRTSEYSNRRDDSRSIHPSVRREPLLPSPLPSAEEVIYEPRLQSVRPLPCSVCGTPTAGHCHRCKTRYCSRTCQRDDWEVHSVVCREPDLPSLVVTAGGDTGERAGDGTCFRGSRPVSHASRGLDGYQSEAENRPSQRGRGRVRAPRGGRGAGGDGRPVYHLSPTGSKSLTSRPRRPESVSSPPRGRDTESIASPPKRQGAESIASPPRAPVAGSNVSRLRRPHVGSVVPPVRRLGAKPENTTPGMSDSLVNNQSPKKSIWGPNKSPEPVSDTRPVVSPHSSDAAAPPPPSAQGVATVSAAAPKSLLGSPPEKVKAQARLETVCLQPDRAYEVVVSHVESARVAYVRLQDQYGATCAMEQQLQQAVSAAVAPPLTDALCAALFENAWYRGRVIKSSEGHYNVFFVDWGNTASLPASAVVTLPSRFCLWPAQAVQVLLHWQPAAGMWSQQEKNQAAALLEMEFTAHVLPGQDKLTVTLTDRAGRDPLAPPAATPAKDSIVMTGAPGNLSAASAASRNESPARPVVTATGPAGTVGGVAALERCLPDNLPMLYKGDEPLFVLTDTAIGQDGVVVLVGEERCLTCADELNALPDTAAVGVQIGDIVVATENGCQARALVCDVAADGGLTLLFVDSGSLHRSVMKVRPLPERWSLSSLPPVTLCVRVHPSALQQLPLLLECSDFELLPRPPVNGQPAAEALLPTKQRVPVLLSSCRYLLHRLIEAGISSPLAVPAPAASRPDPAVSNHTPPVKGSAVPRATLQAGSRQRVLPTALHHPQRVNAQLQSPTLQRDFSAMDADLQRFCSTGAKSSEPAELGHLVAVRCGVLDSPTSWRRAEVTHARGSQLRLRLLDWAVDVTAPQQQVRPLSDTFATVPALGVEFGLAGIGADACGEVQLPFYRGKLINVPYNATVSGIANGVPQVVLHGVEHQNFCFNDKMAARIAGDCGAASGGSSSASQAQPSVQATLPSAQAPRRAAQTTSPPVQTTPPAAQFTPPPAQTPSSSQPAVKFREDLPVMEIESGSKLLLMVTMVVSASNVQGTPITEQAIAVTTALEEKMPAAAASAPLCSDPQTFQLVLTKTPLAEGAWARAAVLEVVGDRAVVLLVDYGVIEPVVTADLRFLPDALSVFPAGAVELKLRGFDQLSEKHDQVVQEFLSLSEEEPLEVTVISRDADVYLVEPPEAIVENLRADGATI